MPSLELLKNIIREGQISTLPKTISRHIKLKENTNQVISVIGSRRSGKTYLLYELMHRLVDKGVDRKQMIYFNFEDERLMEFKITDFDLILQAQRELYPEMDLSEVYFFFDEIQNIEGWEKFIRRIHEAISKNIYITGSNSKLLSSEIATTLRGRTLPIEVYPLSFKDFLSFKSIEPDIYSSTSKAKIINALQEYLKYGGFPDIVFQPEEVKNSILQEYFNVMIYKDIVERYKITSPVNLKYFIKQLIQCHGSEFTVNKIYNAARSVGLKTSRDIFYDYIDYAQNIYMVIVLRKYEPSVRVQEQSEKKVYAIDNGLFNSVSQRVSPNIGKLLEAAVLYYLIMTRGKENLTFYKENGDWECDFLVQADFQVIEAVQVSVEMLEESTRKRELKGITKACQAFGLQSGTIITLNTEEEIEVEGIKISVVPAWKCFLG